MVILLSRIFNQLLVLFVQLAHGSRDCLFIDLTLSLEELHGWSLFSARLHMASMN